MFKSLSILLAPVTIFCQCTLAGDSWDEQFGVPGSSPGGVAAVAVLGNRVFVGGGFTKIGGVAATNLAQWDGTNWAPVSGGVGGVVYALAVDHIHFFAAPYEL